jgi:hypothetical protein
VLGVGAGRKILKLQHYLNDAIHTVTEEVLMASSTKEVKPRKLFQRYMRVYWHTSNTKLNIRFPSLCGGLLLSRVNILFSSPRKWGRMTPNPWDLTLFLLLQMPCTFCYSSHFGQKARFLPILSRNYHWEINMQEEQWTHLLHCELPGC